MWYLKAYSRHLFNLYFIALFLFIMLITGGCHNEPIQETAAAFRMSDTMLHTTTFASAELEQVKDELNLSGKIGDIAQTDKVWVLANVNETDIGKIKPGTDAEVRTLNNPDKAHKGSVDKIFTTKDPDTKAMKVRIKIANSGYKLKPEMAATVKLRFNNNKIKIAIPTEAVIFDKSRHYVMVFKNRTRIETREVKLYSQVSNTTYIEEGLQQHEKVITHNQLRLYDALND